MKSLNTVGAEYEAQRAELEQQLTLVTQRIRDLRQSFDDYRENVERESRCKMNWRTISIIEYLALVRAVVFAVTK
jgi:hypothetical protein